MQKRRLVTFLLLFCFLTNVSSKEKEEKVLNYKKNNGPAITEANFDENAKPKEETPKDLGPKKKFKGNFSDDLLVSSDESKKEKTVKELKVLVEGLDALIKMEKNDSKKIDLIFSKAAAYLNIAKNYRITTKKDPTYKDKENANLKKSIQVVEEVEKSKFADDVLKGKSYHLHGMALVFLHEEASGIEYFVKSIEINRNAAVNPRLSIFIAEYLFDKERYLDALPRYSEYFTKLTQEEKAMVIYKSAWCFVLTKQFDNAEKAFIKIIGKPWAGDFATDALRDLAFTTTSHMKEQEVIDFGAAQFPQKDSQLLVDYYTESFLVFLKQSGNIDRPLLYNEILKIEKRPERKIALSVKKLASHQKDYASLVPFEDLMSIEKLMKENDIKPLSDSFKFFGSELENETLKITKAYADTISKKLKTPEKFENLDMSENLEKVLWFHIIWFPESPKVPQSYMVSLDNCLYLKNNECSIKVSRDILKKDKLKNIWERARFDLITSLDKMSLKDPKFKDELATELIWFAANQESSKYWLPFTKRLTALQVEAKKYEDAFPLLDKINSKEPSNDNLYRKLFCAFQQTHYSVILEHMDKAPKEGPYFQEIQVIMRESSLQLALDYVKKDEFEKYEFYLSKFMSLNPEQEKADLARVDYFQRLIDKEQNEKVVNLLIGFKPEIKFSGTYSKISKQVLLSYIKTGKFTEAQSFLAKDSKIGQFNDFNAFWFRILYSNNASIGIEENKIFASTTQEERSSILGLLTLTKPEEVIKYFGSFAPKNDQEKRILLLSYQIKEGQREAFLPPKYFEMVKNIMPADLLNIQVTPSEKLANYIEFPEVKWSESRLEKVMPDAVSRVRAVRPQVLRDLKGKNYSVQKRILTKALSNETKMLDFFKNAPLPKGLSPENLETYKKELQQAAIEFNDQADEFKKMIDQVSLKVSERKKDSLEIPSDMKLWPKPILPVTTLVDAQVVKKNYFGALVILETHRGIEKINLDDYHMLRSFVILSQPANPMLIKYVQDELKAAKQDKLLTQWQELLIKKEPVLINGRELASDKDKDKDKK